ncbi:cytoskeletal protein binding protein [Massospora cicadina]|nr:cytoskeletal protein binding protein [Massospora cicadina]
MEFKRICRALYRYDAVEEGELSFEEDGLLYIWDDTNPEWWRASLELAHNEAELVNPAGLIPYNYVEEGAEFQVYQKDGEDWMLVNYNGVFGFVPQSYVEEVGSFSVGIRKLIRLCQLSEVSNEDRGYADPPKTKEAEATFHEPADEPHREPATPSAPISVEPNQLKGSRKDDLTIWRVLEVDKKKKSKKKVRLGISSETFCVAGEDGKAGSSTPKRQWLISDLVSYGINNKHVLVEISGENPATLDFSCGSIKQAETVAFKIRSCSGARYQEKVAKSSGLRLPPPRGAPQRLGTHIRSEEKSTDSPLPPRPFEEVTPTVNWGREVTHTVTPKQSIVSEATTSAFVEDGVGEIAAVLYDFNGIEADELSVQANERIHVIDSSDSDWWMCRVYYDDGRFKDGLVPSDYVSLLPIERTSKSNSLPVSDAVPMPSHDTKPASATTPVPVTAPASKDPSGPNPDRLREWTDATGSFKVEAEFIKYADGKFHLHKANGVKIAVPLEKMSAMDVHYVSEAIGQDLSGNFEAAKKERAEVAKWKDFLLEAGVSAGDAATYATKFTQEKIDRQLLCEMDRPTLKSLGLTEGDALRVEKATRLGKADEDDALARRLQQEEVERLNKDQIEKDAMLARKLQDEAGAWQNFSKTGGARTQKYGLSLGNKTGRPSKGVNLDALFQASAKLQEESLKDRPKSAFKTASTKSGFNDDIWAVPGAKPEPKPLVIPDLSSSSQQKSQAKLESVETPIFSSRKDASRSKSSQIEERWGSVRANFEKQLADKPDSSPQTPPLTQTPPMLKPAGPLAQPLIPVPRGVGSNVFVPTRRPPPPKPVTDVFADAPVIAPSLGVTTRAAPKADHSTLTSQPTNLFNGTQSNFGATPVLPNPQTADFTTPPINIFANTASKSSPKLDGVSYTTQSNLFSKLPSVPAGNTGFNMTAFSGASQSIGITSNAFSSHQIAQPVSQASVRPTPSQLAALKPGYQFEDLSLESLGLKPAPVPSLFKPEARPHSSMGIHHLNNHSAFEATSSFAFGDASLRPGTILYLP